ncbi:MAG: YicC family protein [Planctomycetes bacterium]|nr:YicC family protein [Planctomycetota bacterium]
MRSMTGHGQARARDAGDAVDVEVRSVNHRYLKVHARLPEPFGFREGDIEEMVREVLKRGAVDIDVRVTSAPDAESEPFDLDLVKVYYKKLKGIGKELGLGGEVSMEALLALPGVVKRDAARTGAEKVWPKIAKTVKAALADLEAARKREGERLKKPLKAILKDMARLLKEVKELAPAVVEQYRDRLKERVARLLNGTDAPIAPPDLGREIAMFADRCDISEELARQESHLKEFDNLMAAGDDAGRRLDFISQEMLREANTMGAKANDARLTQRIVAMKAEIEKLKEQIQNIE